MEKIKELREELNKLAAEIKRFADKANDPKSEWTNEDQENFEKLNSDYDAKREEYNKLDSRLRVVARHNEIEQADKEERDRLRRIGRDQRITPEPAEISDECRGLALRSWILSARRKLTDDELHACAVANIDPFSRELEIPIGDTGLVNQIRSQFIQKRALSTQIGSAGGFTIPDSLINTLEIAMIAFGGMRQASTVIRTDSGATISYPTTDDTSNTGELVAENSAVSEGDVTFGAVNIGAYQYSSKLVKVPVALLEDSAFDIPSLLGQLLGERLERITNTHFTVGDGVSKPTGITEMTTLGVTAAAANAITLDEVIDLIDSVDQSYWPGAQFMLHRSTLSSLRKLKDSQNQYLWTRGTQAGEPDTLWGFPYVLNADMPQLGTGNKTLLFGQLSKYVIREVNSVRMRRLVERYAEYDQEAFLGFMRSDGKLIDAGAHPVKHLVQA